MIEAGYSEASAKNPKNLTESKGWKQIMEERLSDEKIAATHERLMNAHRLDHMVFPLGCVKNEDKEAYIKEHNKKNKGAILEIDVLSDEDIIADLASVNCTVRRIVHGETARHVYFWAPDNKAQKDAADMGYKLKGHYAAIKHRVANATGYEDLSDEELDEKLAEQELILKRHNQHGKGNKAVSKRPRAKQEKPKADLPKRRATKNSTKR